MRIKLKQDKEAILKILQSEDIERKLRILEKLDGVNDKDCIKILIKTLEDKSWCMREKAAYKLATYGSRASSRLKRLLKKGYWITLDFPVTDTEWVLESGYTEYNRFIPMVSVKLPYIDQLGYNACIKLDDKDFDATNPGVWVHKVHDLKTRETFTDWSKYSKDEIIKLE